MHKCVATWKAPVVACSGRVEHKGQEETSWRRCSFSWLQRWFDKYIHMSKLINCTFSTKFIVRQLYLNKAVTGFPGGAVVEILPTSAGDTGDLGSISELGRTPGGGNGNPLQSSCLENPMDRGAWRAIVRGAAKRHDWARVQSCKNNF